MLSLRRFTVSPLEGVALLVLLATGLALAIAHAGAEELVRGRDEALTVLETIRKAQADHRLTKGTFLTALTDLRATLVKLEVKVETPTTAKGRNYRYFLAETAEPDTWRVTAIGNLDEDDWPDIVVVSGNALKSAPPAVECDDVEHRLKRVPTLKP
jgi:hypothetical protein